jgi:serine protease inhibitor
MKTTILFALTLLIFCSCDKDEDPIKNTRITVSKTTREIIRADNDFGISLFREVVKTEDKAANIFISPTSVAIALAMTYNGARGTTRTAMENTLRKTGFSMEEINVSYKSLIDALVTVDPDVTLEIANSIWHRPELPVLPDFISINSMYYDAEVNALDFNSPGSLEAINGWVKLKTHDKITEIIDQIPSSAIMYLINAIYFKGIWRSEFDKDNTADGTFTSGEGNMLTVPMMEQQDTFRYYRNEQFACVELPYGQGNFNMVILLPESGIATGEVINDLTPESWESIINSMAPEEVYIRLPRFKFDYDILLNDVLRSLGMGVAFTDSADFSGICEGGGIRISKVIHKTFVEVDEEGTEAAAVTAVEIIYSGSSVIKLPVSFVADRPFIFAIREQDTGSIVFIGCVRQPV